MSLGLVSCDKGPAEQHVPGVEPPATRGVEPPVDPVVKPPDDPPVAPPEPPPENSAAVRGWRYGDDLTSFIEKGPPGLQATCGKCHVTPAPDVIVAGEWPRILGDMKRMRMLAGMPPDEIVVEGISDYYMKSAPSELKRLPLSLGTGGLEFRKEKLGSEKRQDAKVANVNVADVDGDGKPEVLVCDSGTNTVSIIRRSASGWTEEVVASCAAPGHTAVFDSDKDGDPDIAIAGVGKMQSTDNPIGYVLLLVNNGAKGWEKREIATAQPRVTDVEPADVDGDGDQDLIVGAFGWRKNGYIGWLRNDGATWELVKIADRTGTIHVPVADLDADGRPDFVAIVAQEAETVTAYMNKGGKFEAKILFEAGNPLFGSSGLELADLDRDGDIDMLFTNGDALSDPCAMPWPYHGVQWLENRGKLDFAYHDIGRCYGPFRAVAADLDGDGDTDVAVAMLFGMWDDNSGTGLLWYENDGKMSFTRHDVPGPTGLITLAVGNLDGDGTPELVTGRMVFLSSTKNEDALLKWSISKKK